MVPEILPVSEIDERVQLPLFSLGTEITTPSGSIDNLFLSQSGHLVVVETKLWRNPEARREVVAQILDYAGCVRQWRYEDIERLWARRHPAKGDLWQCVAPRESEEQWIDQTSRNLARGRMTLLVVGDGIRSQAQQLAEAVAGHPDFPFRLGLVALLLYEMPDERVLVVPDTLARTQEIERAIVRITYHEKDRPEVAVEVPVTRSAARSRARGTLSAEEFLADLSQVKPAGAAAAEVMDTLLGALEQTELLAEPQSGTYAIYAPDPIERGEKLSLAVIQRDGLMYGYLPWLHDQVSRRWGTTDVADRLTAAQAALFEKFGGEPTKSGKQINVQVSSLKGREQKFANALVELLDMITKLGCEILKAKAD
jgi:hypothetical protein